MYLECAYRPNFRNGGLGKVETKHIKVLNDALKNYDDMEYGIEPAKEIIFEYLKNKKDLRVDSNIKDFGFSCINETLIFKHRDEKLRDYSYLFNTETGEVYFINKALMNKINLNIYNDYNKVISIASDIQLLISSRSM
jgi:hypothetical protein